MKLFKNVFAPLCVALFITVSLSASTIIDQDKPIVNITQVKNAKAIHIQLANLQKQRTQISLIGADGKVWHSNYVWRKNGYSANLSLHELEPGDYLIRIRNKTMKTVKAFALSDSYIVFFNETPGEQLESPNQRLTSLAEKGNGKAIAHFAAPQSGKSVMLQLANLQGHPATVSITNIDSSAMLFERSLKTNNGFGKSFNLEGAADGSYYFYVKAGDLRVFQFFKIHGKVIQLGDSMTHYGDPGDSYSMIDGNK